MIKYELVYRSQQAGRKQVHEKAVSLDLESRSKNGAVNYDLVKSTCMYAWLSQQRTKHCVYWRRCHCWYFPCESGVDVGYVHLILHPRDERGLHLLQELTERKNTHKQETSNKPIKQESSQAVCENNA